MYYQIEMYFLNILNNPISEATRRAIKQADSEDSVNVDLEHVEKILPQLVSIIRLLLEKTIDFLYHDLTNKSIVLVILIKYSFNILFILFYP